MPSSASFPVFRIDWCPNPYVMGAIPVLAGLSIYGVVMSGLSSGLQPVIISGAVLYAAASLRRFATRPAMMLESEASGALLITVQGNRRHLADPVWRDWGYLIELSGRLNGNERTWFWLVARMDAAPLRQLRLLIRAQDKKAASALPSIITNPVL
jgi:hypothetical protein